MQLRVTFNDNKNNNNNIAKIKIMVIKIPYITILMIIVTTRCTDSVMVSSMISGIREACSNSNMV